MVLPLQVFAAGVNAEAWMPLSVEVVTVTGAPELFVSVTVRFATVSLTGVVPKSRSPAETVSGVELFRTARLAFRMPAPQFCFNAQSQVAQFEMKDGNAVFDAGELRMALTWAGVSAVLCASISATAADTCGVAMLVPCL